MREPLMQNTIKYFNHLIYSVVIIYQLVYILDFIYILESIIDKNINKKTNRLRYYL